MRRSRSSAFVERHSDSLSALARFVFVGLTVISWLSGISAAALPSRVVAALGPAVMIAGLLLGEVASRFLAHWLTGRMPAEQDSLSGVFMLGGWVSGCGWIDEDGSRALYWVGGLWTYFCLGLVVWYFGREKLTEVLADHPRRARWFVWLIVVTWPWPVWRWVFDGVVMWFRWLAGHFVS